MVDAADVKASNTTAEQDRSTADKRDQSAMATVGQRRINLMWEITQATIALSLMAVTIVVIAFVMIQYVRLMVDHPEELGDQSAYERIDSLASRAFNLLSSLVSLVIGFYFGRTNHTRTGGVKEDLRRGE